MTKNNLNTTNMKMKLVLLVAALTLTFGGNVMAQTSEDCTLKGSIFIEPAKAKNYDAALPHYAPLVEMCPKYSLATYQLGEKMFKHFIKKGDKSKVNDLIKLYDDRLKYFPKKTKKGEISLKVAQLKYDNGIGSKMDQYKAFENVFNNYSADFKSPKSLYTYFSLAVDLYNKGSVDVQNVFDLYDSVTGKLETEEGNLAAKVVAYSDREEAGETLSSKDAKKYKVYEKNLGIFGKVRGSVDGKLGQLADCPNLIPLYTKDFEAKKNDVNWLKRAAGRLSAKDCGNGLFFKMVQQLHKLEPSAKSAYYLGRLADKDGKSSQALKYYNQSADLETNSKDKARVYYSIAENFRKSGKLSKARTYYNKMLSVKPNAGVAYLKIAQMYASSANNCGSTPFEKRAMNWLAANMADKAAKVDGSIAKSARKSAATYRARAPQKSDIFTAGNEGQKITFNCWVGGSVRVPNL